MEEQQLAIPTNGKVALPFKVENPQLWYPLNYGKQTRYELQASVVRNGKELHSTSKLIGFRRTELVQEPDAHGKSFYFRINNVDVFGGGSCWIPADSYLSQITPERYYDWIKLMAEGNQVMVRVWGGGIYEDDALLDACDELGVLVWHDFQFACASYPTYPSYLKTLEVEVRQQLQRLRWHPSVVAWAGNNEDYQVQERYQLDYDFENKDPESWLKSSFPARYIYEHFLPELVKQEDPSMIYHPSSPWGDGKPTADATVGDIHQWNRKLTEPPPRVQNTNHMSRISAKQKPNLFSLAWCRQQISGIVPPRRSFRQRIRHGSIPPSLYRPSHDHPRVSALSRLHGNRLSQQGHLQRASHDHLRFRKLPPQV
jgi:beta-mannosidase